MGLCVKPLTSISVITALMEKRALRDGTQLCLQVSCPCVRERAKKSGLLLNFPLTVQPLPLLEGVLLQAGIEGAYKSSYIAVVAGNHFMLPNTPGYLQHESLCILKLLQS